MRRWLPAPWVPSLPPSCNAWTRYTPPIFKRHGEAPLMRQRKGYRETAVTGDRRPLTLGPALFALLLSLLWSGNSIAIKLGLRDAPPLRLGWMRFLVGGIVVLLWARLSGADLRVRAEEWGRLLILGLLFSIQLAFMNIGLSYTTAGNGVVLNSTYPIWVALLAHFFIPGDRLTPGRALGIALAYTGVVVVFSQNLRLASDLLFGNILMLISGGLLGSRLVYTARVVQSIHPAKLLLAQAIVGGGSFFMASTLWEPLPYRWTGLLFLSIFYQGAIVAGFNFIGNTWLLKHYPPSRISVISLSQPLFGVLLSWLILGEPLSSQLFMGAILVILGAGLTQRRQALQKRRDVLKPSETG
ncbi:MAG: DMT family transporter [Nitrospinota bacterium]|nr:MAG: DMT family transporter [Nitrospinota bacterium]